MTPTHELWASPRSIIEKGGVDPETMAELRSLFLAIPERDDVPGTEPQRENEHECSN